LIVCGIAGIIDFEGRPIDGDRLEAMARALRHRGPDDGAFYLGSGRGLSVGLVHRRLSIIDLSSAGRQPMGSEDDSLQVVANGEIYNFQDLRADLERRHPFRSQSDTEVILHLYEEQGDDCVRALDGMFAFALWDSRGGRLLLARDRLGKKPLYYAEHQGRFAFASEVSALMEGLLPPSEVDVERIGEYLTFGFATAPNTLLRGVYRVLPGAVMTIDSKGSSAQKSYWSLPVADVVSISPQEAKLQVRRRLEEAVRKRLVADVQVGAMLSGGLDSSVVVALMARLSGSRVRTFTVGFEGPPGSSELEHARLVADTLGTDHKELLLGPPLLATVDAALARYGEPFADATALPLFLLARLVREDCPVALTGDGGDEVFGGYSRFSRALATRRPGFLGRLARAFAPHLWPGRLERALLRFARSPAEALLASSAVFDVDFVPVLVRRDLRFHRRSIVAAYEARLLRHAGSGVLRSLLAVNLETYLADDLLPKTDLMTMAHAVEARCPLLDQALVEYVWTLPDDLKIQAADRKRILRDIAADLVPASIVRRPKQGFTAPLGHWFRTGWRRLAEESLVESSTLYRYLDRKVVHKLWRRHLAGQDWGPQVWALVVLERWLARRQA
jgi:asparagine synthase (glutamine-hydrolysing)